MTPVSIQEDSDEGTPWWLIVIPPFLSAVVAALVGAYLSRRHVDMRDDRQRQRDTLAALRVVHAELEQADLDVNRAREDGMGADGQIALGAQLSTLGYAQSQFTLFANVGDAQLRSDLVLAYGSIHNVRRGTADLSAVLLQIRKAEVRVDGELRRRTGTTTAAVVEQGSH